MYMNKRQLSKAFKDGHLEEVKSQCVKYGTIVSVKDWEITEIPRYNGAWRQYKIEHHTTQWIIEMHNGEVVGIEKSENGYKIF